MSTRRDRQTGAALGAAAVDHSATMAGGHAGAKTVCSHAAGVARVAQAFLHDSILQARPHCRPRVRAVQAGRSLYSKQLRCEGKIALIDPQKAHVSKTRSDNRSDLLKIRKLTSKLCTIVTRAFRAAQLRCNEMKHVSSIAGRRRSEPSTLDAAAPDRRCCGQGRRRAPNILFMFALSRFFTCPMGCPIAGNFHAPKGRVRWLHIARATGEPTSTDRCQVFVPFVFSTLSNRAARPLAGRGQAAVLLAALLRPTRPTRLVHRTCWASELPRHRSAFSAIRPGSWSTARGRSGLVRSLS